jgi:beta-galactosidase
MLFVLKTFLPACILLGSILAGAASSPDSARLILNFNQGWRFKRVEARQPAQSDPGALQTESLGDATAPGTDDTAWELVNLPHSVRLEPWNASGGQNFQGICWYRKHFNLEDSWKGKKLFIEFGGAMQVADVWLNGGKITTHYGGYLPFVLDVTDFARFGSDNVLTVRLDNSDQPLIPPGKPQQDLDFAYFGGLYRYVNFVVTDRLHVTDPILANKPAGGGIFITYPQVQAQTATAQVKTEVKNEHPSSKVCRVVQDLLDSDGRNVASVSAAETIEAGADRTFTQTLQVVRPKLWHPNHPALYTLRTRIYDGEIPVDQVSTRIGIRTFEFRPDGLFINGERFFSVGFNHHQDYLYLGYAVPDSAQYREVRKMREAGMTSFRSHYPHARAFMDACDELGVLTIISTPGWQYFTENPQFKQRAYQNTREMIRINRNRPSVILWEVGLNESAYSADYAQNAHRIAHEEFPVSPCYTSGDGYLDWQNTAWQKTGPVFDVLYNDTARPPRRPLWWREFGESGDMNWSDQVTDNRVARGFGEAAMLLQARCHEAALRKVMEADPPVTGAGLWAGIDCDRGYHPMPFLGGLLDKARLPKFSYYLFASQRPPDLHLAGLDDGPMVFIASLLTRYSTRDVVVFCNCDEVRLLRSYPNKPDELVGVQKVPVLGKLAHAPLTFTNAFSRMDGLRLKAQGLIGGKVAAEQTLAAAGAPRRLALQIDQCGRELVADGSDVVLIHASIQDKDGNIVPFDDCSVFFSVSGAGSIVGDASIEANPVRSELGIATLMVRSLPKPGKITVRAQAQGLAPAELAFESHPFMQIVVKGRDVGQIPTFNRAEAVPSRPTGTAARMPGAEVIQEQHKSQNLRDAK